MKKILSIIILLAGVMSFTSCSDDNPTYTAPAQLSIKSADAFYDANGGTGTIVVNSTEAITAAVDVDWLSVSVAGNTVNLTAAANDKLEGRSANVLLSSPSASAKVNITQKGIIFGLTEGNVYEVDDLANEILIPIARTADVNVTSMESWLSASFDAATNNIVVSVEDNGEKEDRFGKVAISTGVVRDTLVIYQAPMVFELETESYMFSSNEADSAKIKVDHSKSVVVKPFAEWIDASFDETDSTVVVKVADNAGPARLGYVAVQSGASVEYLTIGQYDFMQEVASGYYYFWYVDASDNKYHYMPALLNLEESSMILAMSDALMFNIPVVADPENAVLYAGPSTSFAGMFRSYYLYWVWESLAGTWSGYTGKTYSVGSVELYEDSEGNLTKSIVWGGPLGKNTIDVWTLEAMADEEFSKDNDLGYLTKFYFPEMEVMPMEARGKTPKSARTFKGHTGTPASTLKYVLRPSEK